MSRPSPEFFQPECAAQCRRTESGCGGGRDRVGFAALQVDAQAAQFALGPACREGRAVFWDHSVISGVCCVRAFCSEDNAYGRQSGIGRCLYSGNSDRFICTQRPTPQQRSSPPLRAVNPSGEDVDAGD